ncbi:ankyrin repeat domain-containing protein 27-like [Amphiura filiformis]|uniref:ankyrin repeat domain-containing protein 27-like n=1 Tax=Amphiura filiformis TaxID=82378 RepID=UPI003B20BF4F
MESYDEDLSENRFFIILQNKYKQLYENATSQKWTVCIPRTGVFARFSLSQADFENHLLHPAIGRAGVYYTANNKEVHVSDSAITTTNGFKDIRTVHVLFEETYYTEASESFKVLCIDRMLEGGSEVVEDPVMTCLETLDDCSEFLWGNKFSKQSQTKVDELIVYFLTTPHQHESLRQVIDLTNSLFTNTIQIALKDPILRKTVRQHRGHMDNLKVAMETYVMHEAYPKVFNAISHFLAKKDAAMNKTTRNLSDLQVRDVGVRADFTANVPRARRELSTLNQYRTPLEKLHCLRRTIMAISQPGYRSKTPAPAMSSDDLLPLLVFLVVKSEVPNWWANLAYMENFRFSSFADGEFGFYLASYEAAVEHVKSGNMENIALGVANPQRLRVLTRHTSNDGIWQKIEAVDPENIPSLDLLFEHARMGHTIEVNRLLELHSSDNSWLMDQMCHPLCSCDKCEELVATKRNDPRAVTASSRDDRGCTAMHMAAMNGHLHVAEVLRKKGADVNATDYHGSSPLHLACQKGHQKVLLFLLDQGAKLNPEDNDGNTPLHLCCANGHEECVSALLYHNKSIDQDVDVNAANAQRDTPLHLAARWGYESIVEVLLEHGASVEAHNRRKETPLMCSHNVNISKTLLAAAPQDVSDLPDLIYVPSGPNIASTLNRAGSSESLRKVKRSVSSNSGRHSPSGNSKEVEKLLRSVADGDILMVKYLLNWLNDSDDSDDDDVDADAVLCHPLCQCSKCATLQKRTSVTSTGLSVNAVNSDGFTPLHVAALHGREPMLALLLRRGGNINNRNSSSQQCTPLHLACQYNHVGVVSMLLQQGAKCNIKDARGNSPLHYCCLNGHADPAKILINHGANVNQTNQRGNTPLHEAARYNFQELVEILIRIGHANPLSRNKAQLTPIQLAQRDNIVDLLKKASVELLDAETSEESRSEEALSEDLASSHDSDPLLKPPRLGSSSPMLGSSPPRLGSSPPQEMGTTVQQVPTKDLLRAATEMDMALKDLHRSIRDFDPPHRLKRTKTIDKSTPRLDKQLRHQLSIQHFDHRMLKHVETRDQSGPRLWRLEAEDVRIKERHREEEGDAKTDDNDEDDDGAGRRKWDIEEMKLERGSSEMRPQDVRETSAEETAEVSKVTIDDDAYVQTANDDGDESGSRARLEKYSATPHEKSEQVTSGERDDGTCHVAEEEDATSDVKAQRVPVIDVAVHHDESVNKEDSEPEMKGSKQIQIKNDNLESIGDEEPSQESHVESSAGEQETGGGGSKEIEASGDVTDKMDDDKVGRVSNPRPLSPTEMQDMSDKCYQGSGKTELEIPTETVKTHKRSSSNVTIEEMAAMAMDMRKAASASSETSPQHGDERRVGFAEALSSTPDVDRGVDTGTDTSSPAKSVDAPLTDSDVENMEPLFAD